MKAEPEKCAHCGLPKPIVLILKNSTEDKLLCHECADKWLASEEEWGNYKLPKPYFGPFPEQPDLKLPYVS